MIASKGFLPYRLLGSKPYSLRSILLFTIIIGLILHLRYSLFTVISEETAFVSKTVAASHPVERLILQNFRKHQQTLARQSRTAQEAVRNYKKRYNRDPPQGFEKWARFALAHNSTIIDDYDIIEERMAPFRKMTTFDLKRRIKTWQSSADAFETVKIRDGKVVESMDEFKASLEPIVDQLPDMDILLNWLDEPRIVGTDQDSNKVVIEDFGGKDSWGILSQKCKFGPQKRWYGSHAANVAKVRYVQDPKYELDICSHQEYYNMHGFFSSPSNFRAARALVPFLSTTSMSTMNDLLTPGLDYVTKDYLGTEKDVDTTPYSKKKPKMYWRGGSTGSNFHERSWNLNHRVRFVKKFEKNPRYDIGFSNLVQCGSFCDTLQGLVGIAGVQPATVGFEYKYAMDLDGNGYSGRYYRLLQSNCLVFKQTMFAQWHDDRLVPYVHYIPVSLSMDELDALIDYFSNDPKGQIYGERIAEDGKLWSKEVLRSMDMTIYTYRLLLEYASLFQGVATID